MSFFLSWKCFSLIPPGRLRQTLEEAAHCCCDCGEGNNYVLLLLGLLHSASREAFKETRAQITSPLLITFPLLSKICGRERKTGKKSTTAALSCTTSKNDAEIPTPLASERLSTSACVVMLPSHLWLNPQLVSTPKRGFPSQTALFPCHGHLCFIPPVMLTGHQSAVTCTQVTPCISPRDNFSLLFLVLGP